MIDSLKQYYINKKRNNDRFIKKCRKCKHEKNYTYMLPTKSNDYKVEIANMVIYNYDNDSSDEDDWDILVEFHAVKG